MDETNQNKKLQPLTVRNILIKFARQNPWATIVYLAVLVIIPLQDVGLPHVYGKVVQHIQEKKSLVKPFIGLLAIIMIIQIVIYINEWNETYYTYPRLSSQIRKDILQTVFDGHENNFDE
jgi:ABC-type siderophore export system fused ATPase/permease subunit